MTPEIITRDEFIVVGIRSVMEMGTADTGTLWKDRFLPRRNELQSMENGYYGVFNILPDDQVDGRYEYVAGVVTDSLENIPVGMVGWVIPAGTYAEIAATGPTDVGQTCRNLITDWLPDSGYKLVSNPMFAYTGATRPDAPDAIWRVNIPIETPEELAELEKWFV